MKILIVGATGQLGYTILRKLQTGPNHITALCRNPSHPVVKHSNENINWIRGDLLQKDQISELVQGHDVIISTANAASPTNKSDTIQNVDVQGIQHLINCAVNAGVSQFIYTSVKPYPSNSIKIPLTIAKQKTENHLIDSGLAYTIIKPSTFMDIYFPYFGTDLPLRGNLVNTIERPFAFSNNFFNKIKEDIEKKNRFNIIGSGTSKHSYISVDNVAQFHVNAINNPIALNKIVFIGGPEPLSALDIKQIFERILDKNLEVKSTPSFVIKIMSKVLSLFHPAASNIMALNYASSQYDSIINDANQTANDFNIQLQSAESFLKEKMNHLY